MIPTPTATAILTSATYQPFVFTGDAVTGICAGLLVFVVGLAAIVVMSVRERRR